MTAIVLDASFVGLINLPDEIPPETAAALAARLDGRRLYVPSHWHVEIANMLIKAERSGRIDSAGRAAVLRDIKGWPVNVDRQTSDRAWSEILPLADAYRLSAYDAAYFELASRGGHALASNDKQLIGAARQAGIELITPQA